MIQLSMFKKLFASIFVTVLLFVAAAGVSTAHAQSGEWWDPLYNDFLNRVDNAPSNEIFGERYTRAQTAWIIYSLVDVLSGEAARCAVSSDPVNCLESVLNTSDATPRLGPVLQVAAAIDTVRTVRPASSVDYVASVLDRVNLAPEAYAQGYGASNSLQPILRLWIASRNAAYALMTVGVIILAFMIMFRTRLDPRTVISVQSAIPRVVVALLFITFSYAIAGLVIDLGFLVQGIIATLVTSSGISGASTSAGLPDPSQLITWMNNGIASVFAYGIAFLFESFLGGGVFGKIVSLPLTVPGSALWAIDLVIALLIVILLLVALVRIFWVLIRTYTIYIFLVIAGPFIILFSLMRGSGIIMNWIKTLVANMSMFVSVGVLIMFAHILYWGFGNGPTIIGLDIGGILGLNTFQIVNDLADEGSGLFPSGFSFSNTSAIGFFVRLYHDRKILKELKQLKKEIQRLK